MQPARILLNRSPHKTPMIILTAAASRREEALAAGADRFATKPFSTEELEGEVAAVLAEGRLKNRTGARRPVDDLLDAQS